MLCKQCLAIPISGKNLNSYVTVIPKKMCWENVYHEQKAESICWKYTAVVKKVVKFKHYLNLRSVFSFKYSCLHLIEEVWGK